MNARSFGLGLLIGTWGMYLLGTYTADSTGLAFGTAVAALFTIQGRGKR